MPAFWNIISQVGIFAALLAIAVWWLNRRFEKLLDSKIRTAERRSEAELELTVERQKEAQRILVDVLPDIQLLCTQIRNDVRAAFRGEPIDEFKSRKTVGMFCYRIESVRVWSPPTFDPLHDFKYLAMELWEGDSNSKSWKNLSDRGRKSRLNEIEACHDRIASAVSTALAG